MKTPMDHDVVKKAKHGMGTVLKATDPVVKFLGKTKNFGYEPHSGRKKLMWVTAAALPSLIVGYAISHKRHKA